MVVAAGSREAAPLEPIHRAPKASPPAGSPDRPSLHLRERNSSMKNRKRESCTSGTVRDEDGNILIYSARPLVYVEPFVTAGIRVQGTGCCQPPPAQIRTCPIRAYGSYLECLTAKRCCG